MSTLQHDSLGNPQSNSPHANGATESTPISTLQHDPIATAPATSLHAHWLGWVSLSLAAAALVLICLGDPLWLALPITLLGALAGHRCIRRGHEGHVGALIGKNLGLFNLFFWFLLVFLVPLIFGTPTTELFTIPEYH